MDITAIPAIYNSAKFIKESLEVVLGYKIDIESQQRINAALKEVGNIQDRLFHMREDQFRLQTENEQLRKQLKEKENWESQKKQYPLVKTSGGAVVHKFIGTPEYYACPSCFSKETIQILQDKRNLSGKFDCPGCTVSYPIEPFRPVTIG
jgi:regulator of replication initiation timing